MTALAERIGAGAASTDWSERLARFGLVGKGIVHLVVGVLAIELAISGPSSGQASASGAAQWIADRPFGAPALWAMVASLLALTAWRAITTFVGDPVEDDDGWRRGVWAVKALAYGALTVTFVSAALSGGGGGSSDDQQTQSAASTVFDWPMGRWIVVAGGLAVAGIAVYLIVEHAIRAGFAQRLICDEHSTVVTVGRVGYGLRSLAYLLIAAFLLQAGLAGEEQRADGMSGALDRAAGSSWGTALLMAIGVGFLAYGAYCFAESKLRRDA